MPPVTKILLIANVAVFVLQMFADRALVAWFGLWPFGASVYGPQGPTGGFQRIIFHPDPQPDIRRMICSILAGYAWDRKNPYVADTQRRLQVLEQLCTG